MPEAERTAPVDLGLSVADATRPTLKLERDRLMVEFVDWQQQSVIMICNDVAAVRWQEAERYVDENDRYDGTFVVCNSRWLAEHDRQDRLDDAAAFRHLKLNFNGTSDLTVG